MVDFGLPAARPDRCACCGMLLDPRDRHCYLCDMPDTHKVSPPHICVKTGRILTDHPIAGIRFRPLPHDHETDRAVVIGLLQLRKHKGVPPSSS